MFWTWSLSREKTKQLIFSIGFQMFNFKTKNLFILNATKNLQKMIHMALKQLFFSKKITKNHPVAGTQTPNCAKFESN